MQSDDTHRGDCSHLFNSMQSYLRCHNRVQPIIGLGSVIELCTVAEPPVYLCEVCILKINKTDIKTHIMGSLHRYNYIRSRNMYGLKAGADLTSLAWRLMELAKAVEKKEGTGNVKVLHLDGIIYKELVSKPAQDVIAQVKEINVQRLTHDLQSSICNKHNKCDCYGAPAAKRSTVSPIWTSTSSTLRQSRNVSEQAQSLTRSSSPSRTLPEKAQSPVQCTTQAETFHLEGDATVRSPVRPIIQARTSPGYTLSSQVPCLPCPMSPTRAFNSGTAPRPLKRCSPVRAPEQNAFMHPDKTEDVNGVIATDRCIGTDLNLPSKEQTAKRKRVAQCQNSSLTVTITQRTNQENDSCQEMSNTLKLIKTQGVSGALPPVIPQDQDQCQDDPSIQEPFRNAVGSLKYSNDKQEELQQLSPFTPEGSSFGFEPVSRYSVMLSQSELKDHSQTCTVQSPQLSEESPESYRGIHPLIGLQAVIKCQSVDGDPPPCSYLCKPCSLKVLKNDIIQHLISPQHQHNYINCRYPHLLLGINGAQSLQTTAMQLDQEEGRGQMKVMKLSACLFSEVLERDFHWCMKMLNCGSTAEINPKQGRLMPGSNYSGLSISLKQPNECTGITVHHSHDGTLHDSIEKLPLRHRRLNRRGGRPKKAEHKEPVFKVSLSLKAGPVVLDRTSLVSTTVAPEIECQSPEALYRDNDTLSEDYITSRTHTFTPEHKYTEQNPGTFQNTQLHPTEHVYTEENSHLLGYTNAETVISTYGYMNMGQFPDTVEYTDTMLPHSLNSQGSKPFNENVHHSSVVEEVSSLSMSNKSTAAELSSTLNGNNWILERQQVRNNACDWLMEKDPVTQHVNTGPEEYPVFVQSDMTQVRMVKQAPQQMFGERNYEVMNGPMHMYPALTGAYDPAINTYTSYPVQHINQSWRWGGPMFTGFSNQHNF